MWVGDHQGLQFLKLPKEERLPLMVRGCPMEVPHPGDKELQAWDKVVVALSQPTLCARKQT